MVQEKTVTSSGTKYITFLYNGEGLTGFVYDNTLYTYRKNLFGDIIAVYQGNTKVAEYAYDAYGKCTIILNTAGIATINPFRYKGYYFDSESGMYYCHTRYYVPEWCRWLNADHPSFLQPDSLQEMNLFAYCGNNPVMYTDPTGKFVLTSFLVGLGIAVAIGAGIGAVSYIGAEIISWAITGEWDWSWGMFVGSILGGAIGGAISFAFLPLLHLTAGATMVISSGITGFLSQSIGMGLQNAFGEAQHTNREILYTSLLYGGLSALSAGITSKIKIPGFTGRGSISQVTRQISTKLYNGTIGCIKAKTLGKMIIYEAVYSLLSTVAGIGLDLWKYFREKNGKIAYFYLL